jgi:putative nucleotidyltransferase with HDIG domain
MKWLITHCLHLEKVICMLNIERPFQNFNSQLSRLTDELLAIKDPKISLQAQACGQISRSLHQLEQTVTKFLDENQGRLKSLMGVGHSINSKLDLRQVLEEVMDAVILLTGAQRGFLMLYGHDNRLAVTIARGIDHVNLDEGEFAFSKTIIGQVEKTGMPVLTTNAQEDSRFKLQMSVASFHFRSIVCIPLKIRNELIGIIYVENRALTGAFQETDLDLVSAFADQAAVAIENARLFEKLQASHAELEIAYQTTLEGWVRALDYRDKETKGHTQRVTILTERLARLMGVDGETLTNVTRGALLHDIGKMGIPDDVLHKPGPLTDQERALMQKHTVYAYEMLKPIEFLHRVIDIPYCHHERWDGTGYPRGLKGEEIPFAARIFPVIDVWDALVSDRPYRKGMPPEEAHLYIRNQSSTHFDPRVVEAFVNMTDWSVPEK